MRGRGGRETHWASPIWRPRQTDILVRVAMLDRPVQAMRLTAANPVAEIAEKPSGWTVAQTYFVTGIEHILFGFDHLLFVIALVLLLGGAWTVAKAVTAFHRCPLHHAYRHNARLFRPAAAACRSRSLRYRSSSSRSKSSSASRAGRACPSVRRGSSRSCSASSTALDLPERSAKLVCPKAMSRPRC